MAERMGTFLQLHRTSLFLTLLSAALYYTFAHYLDRTEFPKLLALFTALFVLCFALVRREKWNYRMLLGAGILFRLIFLFVEPNLSQDFYRFVWDGHLVRHFINPYLAVPNTLIEQPDLIVPNAQDLHRGMGELSAKHYSNYPPLNQLLFALAAQLGGQSVLGTVIALRGCIVLADLGIFHFGQKLLKHLNRPPHLIFWYFVNPLVIVELTGNLHFEGVMLFFFVWALYLLSVQKWAWAAVVYACSISVKLVPLLFLPLFLKHFGLKKSVVFYTLIGLTSLLLFVPFYSPEFITNYGQTIGLWFSNFEFNASIWNVVKYLGIQFNAKPWELIKTYGKITPLITIGLVLAVTFFRKNDKLSVLLSSMLWILTLYYFMSATVHPWYLIFLVALTVFTPYRFAILWSATAVLSYYAYSQPGYTESGWFLWAEYLLVLGLMVYEGLRYRNKS
ncbi:mannosyltransferase [Maribacter sp. 2307ULW6-5]|uniref:mannosyltransferase n=1 Tax=Maribacter sp. 2307ULW6-5 TaxID=3386275 RepID=UPI0039BCF2F0